MFVCVGELQFVDQLEVKTFNDAIDVWCVKPNVINRRLAGCIKVLQFSQDLCLIKNIPALLCDLVPWSELSSTLTSALFLDVVSACFTLRPAAGTVELTGLVRRLVPRNFDRFLLTMELVVRITDGSFSMAIFIPFLTDHHSSAYKWDLMSHSYFIEYADQKIKLYAVRSADAMHKSGPLLASESWLRETLLVRLKVWMEASHESNEPLRKTQSLCLVDVLEYIKLYNELKKKYAPYFIEIWPETTDPVKFVYEDIAIATYILLLWRTSDDDGIGNVGRQSFVDLGCGNGLLVHILSSEGHVGRGVDISARHIWQYYGSNTKLQEMPLFPDKLTVDEDWIIANHSDELTPWIPVIAARSSPTTKFFLLPCCAHDFCGKFQQQRRGLSLYHSYLDYVRQIGEDCGFLIESDTLRIPSTKKICQVGRIRRSTEMGGYPVDNLINNMLKARGCALTVGSCNTSAIVADAVHCSDFKPRSVSKDPRNCSKIELELKSNVVHTVATALLGAPRVNNNGYYGELATSAGLSWNEWNPGGSLQMNEVARLFEPELLKHLKHQCGGLQTLLKNYRNIFKVSGGSVCLRDYRDPENLKPSLKTASSQQKVVSARARVKTKRCWFYEHHPHGCVLTAASCSYAHGDMDLKASAEGT